MTCTHLANRQTSGESASLPQYDEGAESAEVATSVPNISYKPITNMAWVRALLCKLFTINQLG
jgi:hypothetical protein